MLSLLLPTLLAAAASQAEKPHPTHRASPVSADATPVDCHDCAQWNAPQAPFRIFGNTYYVGVHGLSALLVDTGEGLVLLDGGLPQSAQRIADNIDALGFEVGDVKWILNSHAHFDHAGGIAALQRMSGAQVAASVRGREALLTGLAAPDDPQAAFAESMRFPALRAVRALADGEGVTLRNTTITARYTPGHTPGATTWTWRSCEGKRCVDVVYADSLTAISAPGFRFSDDPARVAQFRATLAKVRALPCAIMVSTHPSASQVFEHLAESKQQGREAFIDANACRVYADTALTKFEARLREEASQRATAAPVR